MKFKVGDVCEIIALDSPTYHGRECVITELPQWMDDIFHCESGISTPPGMYYTIEMQAFHGSAYAMEHELRLKRPPSWDKWIADSNHLDISDRLDAGILRDLERVLP